MVLYFLIYIETFAASAIQ